MKSILKVKVVTSIIVAFVSCAYVWCFDELARDAIKHTKIPIIRFIEIFALAKDFVFLIPLICVIAIALSCGKNRRALFIVPDIMYVFSFGWIMAAIFVWFVQFSSRMDLIFSR